MPKAVMDDFGHYNVKVTVAPEMLVTSLILSLIIRQDMILRVVLLKMCLHHKILTEV